MTSLLAANGRMLKYVLVIACGGLASMLAMCGTQLNAAAERQAILDLYEAQRAAHFRNDAESFLAAVDTGYLAISNGVVQYRRKSDALRSVAGYFQQTKFNEVRDLSPPRVMLARDGRTAWLIGEVEVRGFQRDSSGVERPMAFRAAWLDVYEKSSKGWRLVVRANTQREAS